MGRAFEFRKERKFKRWAKMAVQFTRLGKEIAMAVKDGGANPDANSRLRTAMQNAKAVNMPKHTIEAAIKRATNKDESNYEEIVYEGYAPHGVAILIETATDNTNRTGKDVGVIHTSFEGFGKMQKALDEKGLAVISAKLERVSQSTTDVTEEEAADVLKLIDKLEEDDDVQAVYHNMAE